MHTVLAMTSTLSAHHYIAAERPDEIERERIGTLEAVHDPTTFKRLARLGVASGWRCLEIAAGGGSVAEWLGARVAPRGMVVATDLDPRFLGHLNGCVQVRRHDVLTDELERDTYDLIHVRMLLMHLTDPQEAIAKLVASLRRGGVLCVEDFDSASIRPVERDYPEAAEWEDELRAGLERLRDDGIMDCYLARRHPSLLCEAGLTSVGGDGYAPLGCGGDVCARFMTMSSDVLHGKGAIDDAQVERTRRLLTDPNFHFVGGTLFAGWGRKPY